MKVAWATDSSTLLQSRTQEEPVAAENLSESPLSRHQQPTVAWWEQPEIGSSLQIRAIAVSPLENMSGDASQDYFAEILTEALISELSRIRKLKVLSGAAIIKHRIDKASLCSSDPPVDILIEGSVVRSANQVRTTVTAFHLPTQSRVWSERYDRDLSEILTMQKEVASTIAAQIRADLTPQERMQFSSARLVRPEAYEYYLRGRFYAQRQNIRQDARYVTFMAKLSYQCRAYQELD